MNVISEDLIFGKQFKFGTFCIIEPDVIVGDNVTIGDYVKLKSGTRIGNNVNLADYCKTTGLCRIGNNVNVRTGSCISKSVIVEDNAFIGAGVMTSHTKNIYHQRPYAPKRQLITRVGFGAVIGSSSNLSAGVVIADNVVIGYGSIVTKDCKCMESVYFGNPAKYRGNIPKDMVVPKPHDYKEYNFTEELLKRYLPYYVK